VTDKEIIDFLEAEVKDEPILLHNTNGSEEWPKYPRGLGLTPWEPRTLRQAVELMAASRDEKPNSCLNWAISDDAEGRNSTFSP
jgi:hypothetical protein